MFGIALMGQLEDLFVKEEHRAQGLGKRLFGELGAIAKERNCGRVEWRVLKWNKPSIDFYVECLKADNLHEWDTMRIEGEQGIERLVAMRNSLDATPNPPLPSLLATHHPRHDLPVEPPPQRFALKSPLFTRIPRFSPFSEEKRGRSKTYPTLADEWEDMLWGNKPSLQEENEDGDRRASMGLGLHRSRQRLKGWSRRSTEVGHTQERDEEEDVVMDDADDEAGAFSESDGSTPTASQENMTGATVPSPDLPPLDPYDSAPSSPRPRARSPPPSNDRPRSPHMPVPRWELPIHRSYPRRPSTAMSIDDPRSPDVGPTPGIIALDQLVRDFSSDEGAERPPMERIGSEGRWGVEDEDIHMIDFHEGEYDLDREIQETEGSSNSESWITPPESPTDRPAQTLDHIGNSVSTSTANSTGLQRLQPAAEIYVSPTQSPARSPSPPPTPMDVDPYDPASALVRLPRFGSRRGRSRFRIKSPIESYREQRPHAGYDIEPPSPDLDSRLRASPPTPENTQHDLATPSQLEGIDEIAISPHSLPLKDIPASGPKTLAQALAVPTLHEEISSDPEASESSDSGEEPPIQVKVDKGKGKARAEWTPPQDSDDWVHVEQELSKALGETRGQEPKAAQVVLGPETWFQVRKSDSADDGGSKYSGFRGYTLEEAKMDPQVLDGSEEPQAGNQGRHERGAGDKFQIEQLREELRRMHAQLGIPASREDMDRRATTTTDGGRKVDAPTQNKPPGHSSTKPKPGTSSDTSTDSSDPITGDGTETDDQIIGLGIVSHESWKANEGSGRRGSLRGRVNKIVQRLRGIPTRGEPPRAERLRRRQELFAGHRRASSHSPTPVVDVADRPEPIDGTQSDSESPAQQQLKMLLSLASPPASHPATVEDQPTPEVVAEGEEDTMPAVDTVQAAEVAPPTTAELPPEPPEVIVKPDPALLGPDDALSPRRAIMLRLRAHNPAATVPNIQKSEYNVVPSDPAHSETAKWIASIAAQEFPSENERMNMVYRAAKQVGFHAVWISDEEVAKWNKARRAAKRRKERKAMAAGGIASGVSAEPSQSSDDKESSSGSDGSTKSAREEGGSGKKSELSSPEKYGDKDEAKLEDKVDNKADGNVEGRAEELEAPTDADDFEPVRRSSEEAAAVERHAKIDITLT
ncbi:hypothetical protein EHS25_008100 [Saitozyma podzolica]|uniref:N-acetyltransferase domain-containing protein n=1 Tax=Saitozyma podzolica TaxID=1890683 RepID=A0A427YNK0_9TREE|nr:hypothetical protein EHS25_008100 [Saitozyma podzolica]